MEVYAFIFAMILLATNCFAYHIGRKVGQKKGRASIILDLAKAWTRRKK